MKKALIICVIVVAFVLRVYNLSSVPPHPSLDEVSIGYNAYSILQTGKDEYGTPFPYLLRAYDDYRPALYVYLVIPFVALLGLNELAVRLPSVLLSLIAVIAFYFLVRELFEDKAITVWRQKIDIALASAVFLALSPLHIYISRLGHEVNLFFATFIVGLYYFFRALRGKGGKSLFLSALFLGISFNSYQSGKIFIPLVLIGLGVLYARRLWRNRMIFFFSLIIGAVVISPTVFSLFQPESLIRFQGTSIFNEVDEKMSISAANVLKARQENDKIAELLNNRRLLYISIPFFAFTSHLNPFWLFYNTGAESFKVPNLGVFYLSDIIFIALGLMGLMVTSIMAGRNKLFLVVWFIAGFIPAALTSGYPHAMRIIQVIPLVYIVMGAGFFWILTRFSRWRTVISVAVLILVIFNGFQFSKAHFHMFPKENASQFQYGVVQALNKVAQIESQYKSIYVSNQGNLFQSYMFYLYATRKDPTLYLQSGGTVSGGFAESHSIGKYHFGEIEEPEARSLVVANPDEFKRGTIIDTIEYPNGDDAIIIIEAN